MSIKKLLCIFLAIVCTVSMLFGCAEKDSDSVPGGVDTGENSTPEEHEPITIMDARRDYTKFIELLHTKYPEINVKIEPYRGFNTTAYMKKQLTSNSSPDIYCTTQAWDDDILKESLIDLSRYRVSEQYNEARLREFDVDGATYLLPYDYMIIGITCNKSLLERNGIAIPTSFNQLKNETIPALKAKGINISDCLLDQPAYAFQYFCNISDTDWLSTTEGKEWQKAFTDMSSDVYAGNNEKLKACMEYFEEWIECGMLNFSDNSATSTDLIAHFKQGNTAFFLGSIQQFSQNSDGSGDQYILLPYLSSEGDQNMYIVQNSRFYGLSKRLLEKGNEQKLTDALHFLEVLSTEEGYASVVDVQELSMCSIKNFVTPDNSPYKDAIMSINSGHFTSLIYRGWEDIMADVGNTLRGQIKGSFTSADSLAAMDSGKKDVKARGSAKVYAEVTEELSTVQAAQLCAQMFMEALEADAAMMSYNIWIPGVDANFENSYGVNGRILTGPMTEQDIVSWLPSGWSMPAYYMSISGAEIKKIVKTGLDIYGDGNFYPYLLITKDGAPLEDDVIYKIAFYGLNDAEFSSYPVEETDKLGLDIAKEYLLRVGEVSSKLLNDALLQNID